MREVEERKEFGKQQDGEKKEWGLSKRVKTRREALRKPHVWGLDCLALWRSLTILSVWQHDRTNWKCCWKVPNQSLTGQQNQDLSRLSYIVAWDPTLRPFQASVLTVTWTFSYFMHKSSCIYLNWERTGHHACAMHHHWFEIRDSTWWQDQKNNAGFVLTINSSCMTKTGANICQDFGNQISQPKLDSPYSSHGRRVTSKCTWQHIPGNKFRPFMRFKDLQAQGMKTACAQETGTHAINSIYTWSPLWLCLSLQPINAHYWWLKHPDFVLVMLRSRQSGCITADALSLHGSSPSLVYFAL